MASYKNTMATKPKKSVDVKRRQYQNRKSAIQRQAKAANLSISLPATPEIISEGKARKLGRELQRASMQVRYQKRYNKLVSIAEETGNQSIITRRVKTPTAKSIKALDKKLKRYSKTKELQPIYDQKLKELSEVLEERDAEILTPNRKTATKEGQIKYLERLIHKYQTMEEEELTERVYEKTFEHIPEEAGSEEIPDFDEIVLGHYEAFINLAYDQGHAAMKFTEWNDPRPKYEDAPDYWQGLIEQNADQCIQMLKDIGAYEDPSRTEVINNLATKEGDVYRLTEKFLYFYRCLLNYGNEGSMILQTIEGILSKVTGRTVTAEEKKQWSNLHAGFGEDASYEFQDYIDYPSNY